MARVKIHIPEQPPLFSTKIPLRITDMNYGNHLGNDRLLSIAHEARVRWLHSIGYSELNIGSCGLIMADAMVVYKHEGHYGDILDISIYTEDVTPLSFDIIYSLSTRNGEHEKIIATVKTGMVGYDYQLRKVTPLPNTFSSLIQMK